MKTLIKDFKSTREYRLDHRPIHLLWETEDAEKVFLEPGNRQMPARGSMKLFPKETTEYQLIALAPGVKETRKLAIKVDLPQPEILYFYLEPRLAIRGETIKIHWKVIGAEEVVLSFGRYRHATSGMFSFRAYADRTFEIAVKKAGEEIIRKQIRLHVTSRKHQYNDGLDLIDEPPELVYLHQTIINTDESFDLVEVEELIEDQPMLEEVESNLPMSERKNQSKIRAFAESIMNKISK